jgi:hypothetical protein
MSSPNLIIVSFNSCDTFYGGSIACGMGIGLSRIGVAERELPIHDMCPIHVPCRTMIDLQGVRKVCSLHKNASEVFELGGVSWQGAVTLSMK